MSCARPCPGPRTCAGFSRHPALITFSLIYNALQRRSVRTSWRASGLSTDAARFRPRTRDILRPGGDGGDVVEIPRSGPGIIRCIRPAQGAAWRIGPAGILVGGERYPRRSDYLLSGGRRVSERVDPLVGKGDRPWDSSSGARGTVHGGEDA